MEHRLDAYLAKLDEEYADAYSVPVYIEQPFEIPNYIHRHVQEYLKRVMKKLGRHITYEEGITLWQAYVAEAPNSKRFIDRYQRCEDCGQWTHLVDAWGICPDCRIPF